MPRQRSMITFGYAPADSDDEWIPLAVNSRDMLLVEQTVKGFSAQSFFSDMSVRNLYRIAFVLLKRDGVIERTTTFDQFVAAYDVVLRNPTLPEPKQPGTDDGADDEFADDEIGSEADPTEPTP